MTSATAPRMALALSIASAVSLEAPCRCRIIAETAATAAIAAATVRAMSTRLEMSSSVQAIWQPDARGARPALPALYRYAEAGWGPSPANGGAGGSAAASRESKAA